MKTLQASQPEPPEAVFRERGPPLFPFSLFLKVSFKKEGERERGASIIDRSLSPERAQEEREMTKEPTKTIVSPATNNDEERNTIRSV